VAGLLGSTEVSGNMEFRTTEQEVAKLLEECGELKKTLKAISAQIGRMENRVKRAFPTAAAQAREQKTRRTRSKEATITPEQALGEFDRVVGLVASGASEEAERILEARSATDLLLIAKELGVIFPKSKPSIKTMRDAIFGKVRESVLLSRHTNRG
jgi:hypothetical protein